MKAENKYSLSIGTKRYRVDFCDEAEAIRLARLEGWKEGDSLFDYIDPIANDAHRVVAFKTFDAAKAYATSVVSRDIFRSPEIDEIQLQEHTFGSNTRLREWEITRSWIFDLGEKLIERFAA